MGAVSVDLNKKERWYEVKYPLDNPFGVRFIFEDYDALYHAAYTKGDYDALNVLIDFKQAIEETGLTVKQKDALYYVYELGYKQEEAANVLGIAQKNVSTRIDTAINRIAESQGYNEEDYYEKFADKV